MNKVLSFPVNLASKMDHLAVGMNGWEVEDEAVFAQLVRLGFDLSYITVNTDLVFHTLTYAKFAHASFNGLVISDCNFDYSDFRFVDFENTGLAGCTFIAADLRGASFDNNSLNDVNFHYAQVDSTDINVVLKNSYPSSIGDAIVWIDGVIYHWSGTQWQ